MASGPITSWQIDGKTMETLRFYFLGLQNHCRWWLQPWNNNNNKKTHTKKHLLFGRKAMTNLDSIFKSGDVTFPTKVHLVKAMVFPVVMYGYESWTTKKAEQWRTDAFELWCWKRLLRFPWTARRSNQSILKEISPEYSLEGLMLKLKLQYFGHLMRRTDSLEKTLILGKIEGGRRRGRQDEMVEWHQRLYGHEFEQALGVGDGQGSLACCSPWGCKESDTTEQLNWTELKKSEFYSVVLRSNWRILRKSDIIKFLL